MTDDDRLLSPREAAEMLGVSRHYIYARLQDKTLAHVVLANNTKRIPYSEIAQLIKRATIPAQRSTSLPSLGEFGGAA